MPDSVLAELPRDMVMVWVHDQTRQYPLHRQLLPI